VTGHVAVIDPAMRVPELDCFNRMARASPSPLTYHLPALHGLDSLRRAQHDVRAVIVLGSGASVNESHGWQDELRAWLAPLLERNVPMLGLCYGHQLLAQMTGGEVGFLHPDHTKEKGIRTVRLAADPLWGESRDVPLLVSHREAVVRVPPDADVVGESETCAVEALAWRSRPMWSFQSHPEATVAFAANNAVPLSETEVPLLSAGQALVDRFLESTGYPAAGGAPGR
jgi:GMP synthase (glutamine-hydrolysing)